MTAMSKSLFWTVIGLHAAAFLAVVTVNSGCFRTGTGLATARVREPKNPPEAFHVAEIRAAYHDKERILKQTALLQDLGGSLDEAVSLIAVRAPTIDTVGTRSELIAMVRTLRKNAQEVLEQAPRFLATVDRLSNDLAKGHGSFSAAATLFETYADQEPFQPIAEDYRAVARLLQSLSERCHSARAEIVEKHQRPQFLDTLQFIRHQELLLHRFEAALFATFEDESILEIEDYLFQLTAYTGHYEEFRSSIRDLNRLIPILQSIDKEMPQQIDVPLPQQEPAVRSGTPPEATDAHNSTAPVQPQTTSPGDPALPDPCPDPVDPIPIRSTASATPLRTEVNQDTEQTTDTDPQQKPSPYPYTNRVPRESEKSEARRHPHSSQPIASSMATINPRPANSNNTGGVVHCGNMFTSAPIRLWVRWRPARASRACRLYRRFNRHTRPVATQCARINMWCECSEAR